VCFRELPDLMFHLFLSYRTVGTFGGGSGDAQPDDTKAITKVRRHPSATTPPTDLEQVDQLIEAVQSNMAGQNMA
jgi:hypothetical protein